MAASLSAAGRSPELGRLLSAPRREKPRDPPGSLVSSTLRAPRPVTARLCLWRGPSGVRKPAASRRALPPAPPEKDGECPRIRRVCGPCARSPGRTAPRVPGEGDPALRAPPRPVSAAASPLRRPQTPVLLGPPDRDRAVPAPPLQRRVPHHTWSDVYAVRLWAPPRRRPGAAPPPRSVLPHVAGPASRNVVASLLPESLLLFAPVFGRVCRVGDAVVRGDVREEPPARETHRKSSKGFAGVTQAGGSALTLDAQYQPARPQRSEASSGAPGLLCSDASSGPPSVLHSAHVFWTRAVPEARCGGPAACPILCAPRVPPPQAPGFLDCDHRPRLESENPQLPAAHSRPLPPPPKDGECPRIRRVCGPCAESRGPTAPRVPGEGDPALRAPPRPVSAAASPLRRPQTPVLLGPPDRDRAVPAPPLQRRVPPHTWSDVYAVRLWAPPGRQPGAAPPPPSVLPHVAGPASRNVVASLLPESLLLFAPVCGRPPAAAGPRTFRCRRMKVQQTAPQFCARTSRALHSRGTAAPRRASAWGSSGMGQLTPEGSLGQR
ncbi:basic proline-rich protein-like [Lutra lutra]|uniref:basic proline-rich protein-like n=1 Tax=Lutra lutra TaxID=9657 RepID=UPI001FD024D3|nr:basic proline-rich protein-like [Lutra lutra]